MPNRQTLTVVAIVFASVACTVCANLLLKLHVGKAGFMPVGLLRYVNWGVIASMVAYAVGFVFYAMLMSRVALNIATAIISIQFVAVILAARFLLNEPIGLLRWSGLLMIALGLLLIGFSSNQNT